MIDDIRRREAHVLQAYSWLGSSVKDAVFEILLELAHKEVFCGVLIDRDLDEAGRQRIQDDLASGRLR
jgi:hypothetical protein